MTRVMPMTPLALDEAVVYPDRIELTVLVAHPTYAFSSKPLVDALIQTHPYLLEHTCKNERGTTFAAVADTTSTPHVLEHLIIDNQISALAETPSPTSPTSATSRISSIPEDCETRDIILVGTTQWNEGCEPGAEPGAEQDEVSGEEGAKPLVATVRVAFSDDVAAFAAINAALAELNELLVTTY